MVNLAGFASGALSIFIMTFVGLVIVSAIIGLIWLYRDRRRYSEYSCTIFEKDGSGQLKRYTDGAGVFIDPKTKNKRFFMRRHKVGLNPDNVPYIETNGKKEVYLYKYGLKNFSFIRFNFDDYAPEIDVGEEDVNWALNSFDAAKKRFSSSLIMQLMPFMIIAFVSIVILIIFVYFFKEFSVLKDTADGLHAAAAELSRIGAPTVIG